MRTSNGSIWTEGYTLTQESTPELESSLTRRRHRLVRGKRDLSAWVLVVPSLLVFVIFNWEPLISSIVLSLYETRGYSAVEFHGLRNYELIFTDSAFRAALWNSFEYTFWSLIIGFLFPIVVAIIINEMIHLKSFFKFAVFFPTMVPTMAASLLWLFLFHPGQGGILNGLLNVFGLGPSSWLQNSDLSIPLIVFTMTWRGFGGAVIIYLASLQGVNHELYEAADIDGAAIRHKVRHITIPTIMPIIAILLIMQIIGVFQVMAEPLAMTDGGPNNASLSLMLQSYNYAFRYFQAGRSMAVGVITFLVLMVLNVFYFSFKKRFEG